jgi:Lysozyme like domain
VANLTFSQLQALWNQAGGPAAWGPTMALVALAESGGCPTAVAGAGCNGHPAASTDANGGSYGLWQINGSHAGVDGPSPAAGGPLPPNAWINSMFDPATNAQEAVRILGGGAGISAWTDPVGEAVVKNGGQPLTQAQANESASLSGYGGSGGVPTNVAGVQGVGVGGSGLPSGEGPRWLGLLDPTRCVFPAGGFTIPHTSATICVVDAIGQRRIKGYTVMTVGALGLVLAVAIFVRTGLNRPEAKATTKTVKAAVRPARTARRAVTGRSRAPSAPAAVDPDTAAYEQGRRQAIRRTARESEYSRISGAQQAASERQERAEGFG